ncbi:acyltransferase family protein [Sphingosinicella sp. CPCC 101087]|uniref:acyltransferase family protein n=1 Tax=Sphingosinicella sp. CPCC 101087 TaxID=2497754 RepID=UPI00101DAB8A|nr:acyltransferase family protein [Sphingosinicella sp. CPCC 101087]
MSAAPSKPFEPKHHSKRFDIQFLRGVAVLLVVLFHGFGDAIPRGFLGVDLFFVVSGYLITGMILRDLDDGAFSARAFYLRRAKRLLPATYSTLIGTTLLGYLMLTSTQWSMYLLQFIGTVTFTANIALWYQTDYFAPAAELKPLLHIWSLSLEEQFYFIIPFFLRVVSAKRQPFFIFGGLGLSLLLCILLAPLPDLQSFAFFMLPTRAWELLAGSGCAWLALNRPRLRVPRWLQWIATLGILLVCIVGFDSVHPRGDAFVLVFATSMVILGGDGWLPLNPATRAISTIGDWSYSLYLVHWPLFSFAYIGYLGEPPTTVTALLIGLSLALAWLQYRFVETPFRYAWPSAPRKAWLAFAAMTASVGIVAAPAVLAKVREGPDRPGNIGLAQQCRQNGPVWRDLPACRTTDSPQIALWGDSNAIHLVPGLRHLPIVQITKTACAPIPEVAQVTADHPLQWGRECLTFNKSAQEYILHDRHIRHVVIASAFFQVTHDAGQQLIIGERVTRWTPVARDLLVDALARLRRAGKSVILVGPMPRVNFDPGACQNRAFEGLVTIGRPDCNFTQRELTPDYLELKEILQNVADRAGVPLYLPEDAVCSGGLCGTRVGALPIYRDEGHLTPEGARLVISRLGLERVLYGS